jgi:Lrp/AsnC family leucine-responsive transcriptional regulator
MTAFDRNDFVLLRALQENASRRLEDLSKVVGLAPSSIHERLRRLERLGVIRGWSIEIDPRSLGLDVLAFIGISSKRPCSELVGTLCTIPAVEECHSVAGEFSMLLKVRVTDTASLLKLGRFLASSKHTRRSSWNPNSNDQCRSLKMIRRVKGGGSSGLTELLILRQYWRWTRVNRDTLSDFV